MDVYGHFLISLNILGLIVKQDLDLIGLNKDVEGNLFGTS